MENSDMIIKLISMGFLSIFCTIMKFTAMPKMPWFGLNILYICTASVLILWLIKKYVC